MHVAAYLLLVASFLTALFFSGTAAAQLFQGRTGALHWVEKSQYLLCAFLTLSSMILVQALASYDFSLVYVAAYTDRDLPAFYRLTAFWAGKEGSLLFWAWSVMVFGLFFLLSESYQKLTEQTKLWFWMFFSAIMAFFLLLLTSWSNPFIANIPAPPDGRGLNPLLQNPGMIFHPPLLFLGYGGFVIPGCLALAQSLSTTKEDTAWSVISRPFTMTAWAFLSAGIILGGWWAYMELGWGGYWAWDPVENASLIPWLIATAYLHTGIVESRRGKLKRVNVFLMVLTTISAFFATYLVRGNVVQSLHSFGEGGVGVPLLVFILAFTLLAAYVAHSAAPDGKELEGLFSREGFLVIVAWLFLALAVIVLVATLWPVASKHGGKLWLAAVPLLVGGGVCLARSFAPGILSGVPGDWLERRRAEVLLACLVLGVLLVALATVFWPDAGTASAKVAKGLDAAFYNRTCLPLFTALGALLLACPWLGWRGGVRRKAVLGALLGIFVAACAGFFALGLKLPLAFLTAGAAVAIIAGLVLYFALSPGALRLPNLLGAHGVHLGLALMLLGVAFSGPYKVGEDLALLPGESKTLDGYDIKLSRMFQGNGPGYEFLEAELEVSHGKDQIGIMAPQFRTYAKYPDQGFAEAYTLFSLGDELYATLHSQDDEGRYVLHVSVNPLVNWVWIGGVLLCLFPLLGAVGRGRVED